MSDYEYVIVNVDNRVVRSFGTNLKRAVEFLNSWPVGGLTLKKKITVLEEVEYEQA